MIYLHMNACELSVLLYIVTMLSVKPVEAAPSPGADDLRPPHPSFFPFHIVPGVSNFRDIGGWPTQDGHVRTGILYRGSDTNRIQPEGELRLQELGIKTDFDLRSEQQIQRTGGYREIEGIERRWTPVFAEEQYTEEAARNRYELYAGDGTEVRNCWLLVTRGGKLRRF